MRSPPRRENDAADASAPAAPGRPNVTVTKDTLLEILRQSLERTRSKPPRPSYQQIADDNDVKRTWVTPIVKWAEETPTIGASRHPRVENPREVFDNRQGLSGIAARAPSSSSTRGTRPHLLHAPCGALKSGIAGSELVVFERLSHAGLHEDPETFNRATLDSLQRR